MQEHAAEVMDEIVTPLVVEYCTTVAPELHQERDIDHKAIKNTSQMWGEIPNQTRSAV